MLGPFLFCSCGSDDKDDNSYDIVDFPFNVSYSDLTHDDDGYLYFQTASFDYDYKELISYEVVDIVGEPTLHSHSLSSVYHAPKKITVFKMKFEIELTVEQWNEIKEDVDRLTPFLTYTVKFKLKKGYKTYPD